MSEHSDIGCNIGFDAGYALAKKETADLIEQQAERIKELEAEIGIGHLQCIADRQKYKQDLASIRATSTLQARK